MYFWQVISCNLFLNKNVKIAGKIVKLGKYFGVQLKYSDSLPAFVDCQKDSESTGENGTQVKPVLLAVEIFAVRACSLNFFEAFFHPAHPY